MKKSIAKWWKTGLTLLLVIATLSLVSCEDIGGKIIDILYGDTGLIDVDAFVSKGEDVIGDVSEKIKDKFDDDDDEKDDEEEEEQSSDKKETDTEEACTHNWMPEDVTAPTCTTDGYTLYVCSLCHETKQDDILTATGHDYVADGAADCTGTTRYVCSICHDEYVDTDPLTAGHALTDWTEVTKATCTTNGVATATCSRCGETVTKTVYATGHINAYYISDATGEATAYCTVCEKTHDSGLDVPFGNSVWGYQSLAAEDRGASLQKIYAELLKQLADFAKGTPQEGLGTDECAHVDFGGLYEGITKSDIAKTVKALRSDNAVYYWISGTYSFITTGDTISGVVLKIDSSYQSASVRETTDAQLATLLAEMKKAVPDKSETVSDWDRAIAIYRTIMEKVTYAFDESHNPSSEASAHCIAGFTKGEVVCEGYAHMVQLLFNQLGYSCIFASGNARVPDETVTLGYRDEAHAWNLFQVPGDDKWYWADATFDDSSDYMWMHYFAMDDDTFTQTHFVSTPASEEWMYLLPTTLSNEDLAPVELYEGETLVGRFMSIDRALARITNAEGHYRLVLDHTIADNTEGAADPFIWKYSVLTQKLPEAASITVEGYAVQYTKYTYAAMVLHFADSVTLQGDLICNDLEFDLPEDEQVNIDTYGLTLFGKWPNLEYTITGDAASSVTVNGTDGCGIWGSIKTGTMHIAGTYTNFYGSVTADQLQVGGETEGTYQVTCTGKFTLDCTDFTYTKTTILLVTDNKAQKGNIRFDLVTPGEGDYQFQIQVRMQDAANYPSIVFTTELTSNVVLVPDGSVLEPGTFTGTLCILSGGGLSYLHVYSTASEKLNVSADASGNVKYRD